MSKYSDTHENCSPKTTRRAVTDGGPSHVDQIVTSLQDARRRYLLYHLREVDTSDLETATRRVAASEHDCGPGDVPTDIHDQIEAELYHIHLPKLDDLDVVDYDIRSDSIQLRDLSKELDEIIEIIREEDTLD